MSQQSSRTFSSLRLRRAYGMRLVREPLLAAVKVPSRMRLLSPADVFQMMQPFALQESAETFWALPLNVQQYCTAPVAITRGTLHQSLVHARELFRAMIAANAFSVILCHNHPSGDTTPSDDDRRVTRGLVEAGKVIGIPIRDHVIVSESGYTSFAEIGLL